MKPNEADDDDLNELLEFAAKVEEENNKSVTAEITQVQQIPKKKNNNIKMINIFQKDIVTKLPKLLKLPGSVYKINGTESDKEPLKILEENARVYRKMSLMIYSDESDPVSVLSFSVYDITIIICKDRKLNSFKLPHEIAQLLTDNNIAIICPGQQDWVCNNSNNLLVTMKNSLQDYLEINEIKYLDEFYETLHIRDQDNKFCKHIKLFFWLFQVQIDSQLNGCAIPPQLTKKWIDLIDQYGKLLFFCYDALLQKQEEFDSSTAFRKSTKLEPIHLENIISIYENNRDVSEIKKEIIGYSRYPIGNKLLI